MKILLILVSAAIISGLMWATNQRSSKTIPAKSIITNDSDRESESNPYTIETMSRKEYATTISVVNEIRRTQNFISFKISFTSAGLKQFALMNVPTGTPPESGWPVVIVNHGYIPPEEYSTENSYVNTSAYFANAGFLVLKPDYRGHDDSEGEAGSLISRIAYAEDVLNLMAGLDQLEHTDAGKIFMYGHSMGGEVTLRVLEVSNKVRAATLWAPAVHTFPEGYLYFARKNPAPNGRLEKFESELVKYFPSASYPEVDTLAHVARITCPVNIQHATSDESVPFEWGIALEKKFRAENKSVNFYSYPNDNHDIAGNWSTALNRDIELFNLN